MSTYNFSRRQEKIQNFGRILVAILAGIMLAILLCSTLIVTGDPTCLFVPCVKVIK